MTRWLDYFSIFGYLHHKQVAQNIKNCQSRFKFWWNTKWTLNFLPKIYKFLPNWRNFAKSGRTVSNLRNVKKVVKPRRWRWLIIFSTQNSASSRPYVRYKRTKKIEIKKCILKTFSFKFWHPVKFHSNWPYNLSDHCVATRLLFDCFQPNNIVCWVLLMVIYLTKNLL